MLEKREDLFIGQFPGCLVFADKTEEEYSDYKELARVSHAGNIKYSVVPSLLPDWALKIIAEQAEKKKQEWQEYAELEIKCRPSYFYGKMIEALPWQDYRAWVDGRKHGMTIDECCRALLPVYQKYC